MKNPFVTFWLGAFFTLAVVSLTFYLFPVVCK